MEVQVFLRYIPLFSMECSQTWSCCTYRGSVFSVLRTLHTVLHSAGASAHRLLCSTSSPAFVVSCRCYDSCSNWCDRSLRFGLAHTCLSFVYVLWESARALNTVSGVQGQDQSPLDLQGPCLDIQGWVQNHSSGWGEGAGIVKRTPWEWTEKGGKGGFCGPLFCSWSLEILLLCHSDSGKPLPWGHPDKSTPFFGAVPAWGCTTRDRERDAGCFLVHGPSSVLLEILEKEESGRGHCGCPLAQKQLETFSCASPYSLAC